MTLKYTDSDLSLPGPPSISPKSAQENPYRGLTREQAIQKIARWVSAKKRVGLPGVTLPGDAWLVVEFERWLGLLFDAVMQSEVAAGRTEQRGEPK